MAKAEALLLEDEEEAKGSDPVVVAGMSGHVRMLTHSLARA